MGVALRFGHFDVEYAQHAASHARRQGKHPVFFWYTPFYACILITTRVPFPDLAATQPSVARATEVSQGQPAWWCRVCKIQAAAGGTSSPSAGRTSLQTAAFGFCTGPTASVPFNVNWCVCLLPLAHLGDGADHVATPRPATWHRAVHNTQTIVVAPLVPCGCRSFRVRNRLGKLGRDGWRQQAGIALDQGHPAAG